MKYETHDNGGRPFRVTLDRKGRTAKIERLRYDEESEKSVPEPLFAIDFIRVWVGKSPKNAMTEWSCGYGRWADGNSILFELSTNRYLFVGDCIFEFRTKHRIIDYVSPVGNNDVPYPFSIDEVGNRYLMLDRVMLKTDVENPYDPYYEAQGSRRNSVIFWGSQKIKILVAPRGTISNYQLEHRFRKNKPVFIKTQEGELVSVTRAQAVQLMKNAAKRLGHLPFVCVKVWARREF